MAIVTDRLVIGRAPKCASKWLEKAVLSSVPSAIAYDYYPTLKEINLPDRLNIFFVRHPLSWYTSYWAYRERNGWGDESASSGRELDLCKAPSFDSFIIKCLAREPYLTYLYDYLMAGRADIIWQVEDIKNGLIDALIKVQEDFTISKITSQEPVNVSEHLPDWNDKLAEKMMKHERYVIERWYR